MINVKIFTVNPFMQNTYLLYDETMEAIVIDAGFGNSGEEKIFLSFLEKNSLKLKRLINTHCHIDHIWGNKFVSERFGLEVEANQLETSNNEGAEAYSSLFGISIPKPPAIGKFINDGDLIEFGNSVLKALFTPGHTAGHICFYAEDEKILISGDVLFAQSIGRTDLPGGDYDTLINSINNKLMVLDDDVKVYPGHNEPTTIGRERKFNPFLI